MDYIVLNGKRNTLVQGLMIQSLPPISKPPIRTEFETVDGRDGDRIRKLGYGSYNKDVKIGLTRNYDVDEVIAYFDSEGTVIFSNEPDKYYKYSIVEQIDLKKLIRFKEAKVRFHVQPFKYSAVEEALERTISGVSSVTVTNTGNVASKPKLTVYGSGTVNILVNGVLLLSLDMSSDSFITVDAAELEAYAGSVLKNRKVTGDYRKLLFEKGKNVITWTGSVTKLVFENYSRWI